MTKRDSTIIDFPPPAPKTPDHLSAQSQEAFSLEIRRHRSLHFSSSGRVIASRVRETALKIYLSGRESPLTPNTTSALSSLFPLFSSISSNIGNMSCENLKLAKAARSYNDAKKEPPELATQSFESIPVAAAQLWAELNEISDSDLELDDESHPEDDNDAIIYTRTRTL